ncbi:MAG: FAD-dependent oxidoreductase [Deltaproteobacteria bacterium]
MRVAIVGGGAAGLATAWLLDAAHEVTLFEKEPILGGHVRTLGGNVPCATLPPGVRLDAGVIELDRHNFPAVHAWLSALGVATPDLEGGGSTTLFLADGRHLRTPAELAAEHLPLGEHAVELARRQPVALRWRRFLWRTRHAEERRLRGLPVERFLADDELSTWLRCLLMYAYSVHYGDVPRVAASMAVPMLRTFLRPNAWTHVPAGMSSYVDRVAASLRGRVALGASLRGVSRGGAAGAPPVSVIHDDGHQEPFDAVVLAVPPHRVLSLLRDPSPEERRWFGAFEGGFVETVVHTDTSLYERRGARAFSEFDLFELPGGGHGYNAYLDRLAGLSGAGPTHYFLAFDLDAELDPACILHRQLHDVARYDDRALAEREGLRHHNGARATFFAGAYLHDGLHEGAVRSALAVADRLGGRTLALPSRRA